jgi:uridine kinase
MLARRIRRDVKERGRDVDGILDQYLRFVKNSYDNFVQPSSRYADIVCPVSAPHHSTPSSPKTLSENGCAIGQPRLTDRTNLRGRQL